MAWTRTRSPEIVRVFPPPDLFPGISEGDWIEFELDWGAARRARIAARGVVSRLDPHSPSGSTTTVDTLTFNLAKLEEVVCAWSDSAPVTREALGQLDPALHDWLCREFDKHLGESRRTDAEKNALREVSQPGRQVETSPVRLRTSRK